jgi:hypothetical protein
MTITPFQMYWLTRLDGFIGLITFLLVIGVIGLLSGLLWLGDFPNGDTIHRQSWRLIKPSIIVILFGVVGLVFVPDTKSMVAILIIPKLVNNQKVQEIPNKLLTLAEECMDELRPTKDKK